METLKSSALLHVNTRIHRALLMDTTQSRIYSVPYEVALQIKQGVALDDDIKKVNSVLRNQPTPLKSEKPKNLDSLRLILTNRCNFNCEYCFAKQGSYGMDRSDMTPEVARKSLAYFFDRHASIRQVCLFGGEPLLVPETIEAACSFVRSHPEGSDTGISITTNASLLTPEMLDLLKRYNVAIVGSIDGPASVNDMQRRLPSGEGTFDCVDRALRQKGVSGCLSVEATYTSNHEREGVSRDKLRSYLTERYGTNRAVVIDASIDDKNSKYLEPSGGGEFESISALFNPNKKKFDDLTFEMMRTYLSCKGSSRFCGAGFNKFAVDMNGDIYPCHLFVGNKMFVMGSVLSAGLPKAFSFMEKNRDECQNCGVRAYCHACASQVLQGDDFCERNKMVTELFLHNLMDLLLSDRNAYEEVVDEFYRYGASASIR